MWHSFNKALNLMNNEQWLKQYRNIYNWPNIALYTPVTDLTNLTNQYLQEAPNCVQISEAQVKCDGNSNMLIWNWKKKMFVGFLLWSLKDFFIKESSYADEETYLQRNQKIHFFCSTYTFISKAYHK